MYDVANFFAILPAAVRYDEKLSPRSVLLYAALTSLAQANGMVAYPSNKYLMEILDTSEASIKRFLRELEVGRYISTRFEYKGNTREIARRLIQILELPLLLELPHTQALYAVIPSHILSIKTLSPQAKLLYAEIAAATPTDGYCSKSAAFFAELLHASEPTVRRWIKELQDADAVRIEMEYRDGSREIRKRRIYLTAAADIVDKLTELAENSPKTIESSGRSISPQVSNTPENGQIRGMLIFEPTSKKALKRKRNRHGKRKKATDRLLL